MAIAIFAQRWIERWREMTRGKVDYAKSQDAGAQFPGDPAVGIREGGAVHRNGRHRLSRGGGGLPFARLRALREVDALVLRARAGFRAGDGSRPTQWWRSNRMVASAGTRFLWGDDVRRPTYFAARRGFLKTLGLVYLFAFISLWVQVDGLMGAHGILPASEVMTSMRDAIGMQPLRAPTLCWWSTSDATLHGVVSRRDGGGGGCWRWVFCRCRRC